MGGITKNVPREWTEQEIEWCLKLKQDGFTISDIAQSIDRDVTSVSIKLKRLTKKNDTYNAEHLLQKYQMNDEFYEKIKPSCVLDVYCGVKQYWRNKCKCVDNDKNTKIESDYHMDALKFVCQEYLRGNKYDIVDLDPYGSAYDLFDLAIKMAKKGLVITYGELGHKRWKRLDYVRNVYGIDRIEDFTLETLILKTQEIARHNHKELIIWKKGTWRNIARVYFFIKPYKTTEQWEGNAIKDFPEDINDYFIENTVIDDGGQYLVPLDAVREGLEHYYYQDLMEDK